MVNVVHRCGVLLKRTPVRSLRAALKLDSFDAVKEAMKHTHGTLSKLPPQAQLNEEQLKEIWATYDKDGNGTLDIDEIGALVQNTIDYMAKAVPDMLKAYMDWDECDDEEKAQAAPHFDKIVSSLEDCPVDAIAKELSVVMDLNQDGMVDQNEFIQTFQKAMADSVQKHRKTSED